MPSFLSYIRGGGGRESRSDVSALVGAGQPLDSRTAKFVERQIRSLLGTYSARGSPYAERVGSALRGAQLLQDYCLVASPEVLASFVPPILLLCQQPSLADDMQGNKCGGCSWLRPRGGGAAAGDSELTYPYRPPSAADRSSSDDEYDDDDISRLSKENSAKNKASAALDGAESTVRLRGLRVLARLISSGALLSPAATADIVRVLSKDLSLPPPAASSKRSGSSGTVRTASDSSPRPAISGSSKLSYSYGAWKALAALAARQDAQISLAAVAAAVVHCCLSPGFDAQRRRLALQMFLFMGASGSFDGARAASRLLLAYMHLVNSSYIQSSGRRRIHLACIDGLELEHNALDAIGVRCKSSTLLPHLQLLAGCLSLLAELLDCCCEDEGLGGSLESDSFFGIGVSGMLGIVSFVVSQTEVGRIPDSELPLSGSLGGLLRQRQRSSFSSAAAAASAVSACIEPHEGNEWNRSDSAELVLRGVWSCASLLSRSAFPSAADARSRLLPSVLRFLQSAELALLRGCSGEGSVEGLLVTLRVYCLHSANVLLGSSPLVAPLAVSKAAALFLPLDDDAVCHLCLLFQTQDWSVVRQVAALIDYLLRLRAPLGSSSSGGEGSSSRVSELPGLSLPPQAYDTWWPFSERQVSLLGDCLFNSLCRGSLHGALSTAAAWQVQHGLLKVYGSGAVRLSLPSVLALETFWCLLPQQSRVFGAEDGNGGFAAGPSAPCEEDAEEGDEEEEEEGEEEEADASSRAAELLGSQRLYFACYFLQLADQWALPRVRSHVQRLLRYWRQCDLLPSSLSLEDGGGCGPYIRVRDAAAAAAAALEGNAAAAARDRRVVLEVDRNALLTKLVGCAELALVVRQALEQGCYIPAPDPYTRLAGGEIALY